MTIKIIMRKIVNIGWLRKIMMMMRCSRCCCCYCDAAICGKARYTCATIFAADAAVDRPLLDAKNLLCVLLSMLLVILFCDATTVEYATDS